MKILIAPNEFKTTLTSNEACKIISKEARKLGHEVIEMPISDGGDGFLNAIKVAFDKTKVHNIKVNNPFFEPITARMITNNGSAYIESAEICGFRKSKKLAPLIASSYGVGEAIKKALDLGAKKIYIGLGGVITNDGGVGMARALGMKFLNKKKREIKHGVRDLKNLSKIDISGLDKRIKKTKIYALSDVRNPLLGRMGSAMVYGPQKGATKNDIKIIASGLSRYSRIVEKQFGKEIGYFNGAGAAGGLCAGLFGLLDATVLPGAEHVLDVLKAEEKIKKSDIVISGEGKMDRQTCFGKAPYIMFKTANKHYKPIVFFCGKMTIKNPKALIKVGIKEIFSLEKIAKNQKDSEKNAANYLKQAAYIVVKHIEELI